MQFLGLLALIPAVSAWTSTPFSPHSIPLAVRSPYSSAWLPQGTGTALNGAWPQFWNGNTLGWAGYVKVDGVAYTYLGVPSIAATVATQTAMEFTSTQSIFTLTAGGVTLTVTFLSPIETTDLVKGSLPFSYMTVSAVSNNGASHTVEVYTDISAEWVSGNDAAIANWTTTNTNGYIVHQASLVSPTVYGESNDHTEYGSAYLASTSASATWQTGQDVVVRQQFVTNGVLLNTADTNFRAVNNDWPVFAIAINLGTVGTTAASSVFAVGHAREPNIHYIVAGNTLQDRYSYFWSVYATGVAAIQGFLGDYSASVTTANALDAQVKTAATAISANYYGIVALSLRQAVGGTEITISKTSAGAWDTTDILMFLKEISSDGNVNTVDVISPAYSAYLYLQPLWCKYLLLPLFQYQATGLYPNKWSVHDMGASYPVANGHNDGSDEAMPLEESGNMLIMTLAYTQKSGDHSLISTYTALLEQWTGYLVDDALIPMNQISTDDFAGSLANQTNLAIKGIVGIRAMGEIQTLLGQTDTFSSIATSYASEFLSLGALSTTGKHLTLDYNDQASYSLSYNMFADKLLGTNVFPSGLYGIQAAWYASVANNYGVILDTRHTYTKTDWQILTAALTASSSTLTRDALIKGVYDFASNQLSQNTEPFSDWYDTATGIQEGFRARPVVGGHAALLVLPASETAVPAASICGGFNYAIGNVQSVGAYSRWNVYDDSCNVVDGLTTTGNPCTSGVFGCSAAPIIFTSYTSQFTGAVYACRTDVSSGSCGSDVISVCCRDDGN
ncbi:DUF1793-domain-containing protein [Mycena galopus ATCC 62051]|nr:DUF1793-domain-containing protein [Mycena galopus ATCC 62051]